MFISYQQQGKKLQSNFTSPQYAEYVREETRETRGAGTC